MQCLKAQALRLRALKPCVSDVHVHHPPDMGLQDVNMYTGLFKIFRTCDLGLCGFIFLGHFCSLLWLCPGSLPGFRPE